MSKILLAEDEPRIASFITKGLEAHEFVVTSVSDGIQAAQFAIHGDFDLMILDIGLTSIDGFEVLDRVRGSGSALPVIILTARDSIDDTVAGLESGANDYMSKPFAFEELLARVRLRVRSASSAVYETGQQLSGGGITLDLRSHRALVEKEQIDLTAREFALLEMFMNHADQVLSREQLLSGVWGFDFDPESNVVDVYVRYLRRKIGEDRIETIRGMGYRFHGN